MYFRTSSALLNMRLLLPPRARPRAPALMAGPVDSPTRATTRPGDPDAGHGTESALTVVTRVFRRRYVDRRRRRAGVAQASVAGCSDRTQRGAGAGQRRRVRSTGRRVHRRRGAREPARGDRRRRLRPPGGRQALVVAGAFLLIELVFGQVAGQTPGMRVAAHRGRCARTAAAGRRAWVALRTALLATCSRRCSPDRHRTARLHDRAAGPRTVTHR